MWGKCYLWFDKQQRRMKWLLQSWFKSIIIIKASHGSHFFLSLFLGLLDWFSPPTVSEVCLRAKQNSFCVKSDMALSLSASSSASFGLFTGPRFTHLCCLVARQWIFHQYAYIHIAENGNGCHCVSLFADFADLMLLSYFTFTIFSFSKKKIVLTFTL